MTWINRDELEKAEASVHRVAIAVGVGAAIVRSYWRPLLALTISFFVVALVADSGLSLWGALLWAAIVGPVFVYCAFVAGYLAGLQTAAKVAGVRYDWNAGHWERPTT